jgi:hypothetical protein
MYFSNFKNVFRVVQFSTHIFKGACQSLVDLR